MVFAFFLGGVSASASASYDELATKWLNFSRRRSTGVRFFAYLICLSTTLAAIPSVIEVCTFLTERRITLFQGLL